ncbi:MAG: ATP-binding protein [Gallionellaceae bacterium]|nr:ATP-binding protein [Gallionellaceae bacterium]
MNKAIHPKPSVPGMPPMLLSGMSLRTKGIWVLALFLSYTLAAGFIMGVERNTLYSDVQQLEAVHEEEGNQFGLNMLVTRAILVVNDNYYSADLDTAAGLETAARSITVQIEAVLAGMGKIVVAHPDLLDNIVALQLNLGDLTKPAKPLSRDVIGEVRGSLHKLVFDLDQVTKQIRSRKQVLLEKYRETFDRLSLAWSFTAAIGILFLGSLVMFFVTRLAWDIRRVQDRAMAIVEGYRGKPLTVTRHDELGSLIEAVNKMQFELRQNELQMELIRQQRFHKEKMAAVGSLAAVVAHEINNPLSAVVGAAQAMVGIRDEPGSNDNQNRNNQYILQAEMILEQAKRVMNISRQISEFSTPQSSEPEHLDLNNLIRNTVKFISFDRRFGTIDMILNLDPELPAVRTVRDHLTQVIMNLLVNAADAAEGKADSKPQITIATQRAEEYAEIMVTDNGAGMNRDTLARVFEEFFTTKPPGKGSGIGLAVSKSLIESDGGTIGIESEPEVGTTVTIHLPLATEGVHDFKEI